MKTLSPKKQEILARCQEILDTAFDLLERTGLTGVRLDDIAQRVGCTRGTIYNHFGNREEMLVAMAQRSVQNRLELFKIGIANAETSRERILGICIASMVYADQLPLQFAMEQAVRHETVSEKTSDSRRDLLRSNEKECVDLAAGVIDEAICVGDLPLPSGLTVEQMVERVVFGLWSMAYGGLMLEASSPSLGAVGIRESRSTIHHNCNALLDAYQWRPLFEPIRYQGFLSRITPVLVEQARRRHHRFRSGDTESDLPFEESEQ